MPVTAACSVCSQMAVLFCNIDGLWTLIVSVLCDADQASHLLGPSSAGDFVMRSNMREPVGAPNGKRRRDLVRGQVQREVERRDHADDADGEVADDGSHAIGPFRDVHRRVLACMADGFPLVCSVNRQ